MPCPLPQESKGCGKNFPQPIQAEFQYNLFSEPLVKKMEFSSLPSYRFKARTWNQFGVLRDPLPIGPLLW